MWHVSGTTCHKKQGVLVVQRRTDRARLRIQTVGHLIAHLDADRFEVFEHQLVPASQLLREPRHLFLTLELQAGSFQKRLPISDMERLRGHSYLGGCEDVAAVPSEKPEHFAKGGYLISSEEDRVQADNAISTLVGQA